MTTTDPATVQSVLDRAHQLGPTIAARAAEIEADRRVPTDLLDELRGAGFFRMLLPRSHGGLGADLPSTMRMVESLARADASVAWTVMIGGGCWVDLVGLPRTTFDALFAAPGVIVAGVINPTGSITAATCGHRVTGRWAFASGCEHATWLYANCVEGVVDGVPRFRGAVFAPDEVVIEDTWTVSGLCGTGSHHFRTDVVVAAERTFRPFDDPPCLDEPVVRIPPPALLSLQIAAVALGAARGALDDVLAIAADKVPLLAGAPLATNPLFQYELATADTELRAARALLREVTEAAWGTAADGSPWTPQRRAHVRAAAVWATTRATAVVETAYRSGGGNSPYVTCPLQRRLRDVHALTQHFLLRRDTLTTAGAVLAGQELTVPVF